MKLKSRNTLTPKLRFPEFRKESGWEEKPVNAISEVNPNNDGLPDSFVYIDLESVEQGKLVAQKFINREGAPSRAQRLLRKQDVIYQTVRPYQRNNLFFDVEDGRDYVASTGYAQLRAHASPAFLFQLLHTDDFVNRVLAKCTGSNYPAINSSDLAAIEVAVPSPPEQQKIAECLGSLDGLIAAAGRKLAALRDHKRGLMQQLFPQPGQTQPRLRFPEFRDRKPWKNKEVGDVFDIKRGQVLAMPLVHDIKSIDMPYPVYSSRTKDQGLSGYYSEYLFEDAITWTTDGANAGDVNYRPGKFYCTNVCGVLLSDEGYANLCIAALLNSVTRDHVSYVGNPKLMNGVMAKIVIPFPEHDEQQRISDCLSALDTLIAAQAEKIDALKTHKRGLMQQLFPAPEEQL